MIRESRYLGPSLRATAAIVVLATVAMLVHTAWFATDAPFLVGGPAPFITADRPIDTQLVAVAANRVPEHVFIKRFDADGPASATLEVRALRGFEVELNGRVLPLTGAVSDWRTVQSAEIGERLLEGRNELRIIVRNPKGPPVVQALLSIGDRLVQTDDSWRVAVPGSNPTGAVYADDTRPHPHAHLIPEPGQIIRQHALAFGIGFAGLVALAWASSRYWTRALTSNGVSIAFAVAFSFWVIVFFTKMIELPVVMGFDAPAHLYYVEAIRDGRLPLASEGFSTYHPPLFYLMTAGLAELFRATPDSEIGRIVYRLVSMLSGLLCVLFAGLTARRLYPESSLRIASTTILAAVLPVNVYMAGYLSNESLHAALVSGALYFAVCTLLADRASSRTLAGLALCLAFGLLTKFTSLMVAPLVLVVVFAKLAFIERRAIKEIATMTAGICTTLLLVSGWFYARNLLEFGDPVVWNLDVPGAATWWLQPGYHTPSYYLSFGEGIRHPLFAGFQSFWDGVYSTLWGDGLVAGMASALTRHGLWNEDFMLVGYWLALPMLAPLAWGFVHAVRPLIRRDTSVTGRDLSFGLLAVLLWALGASLLLITLRLPFYAQARASYILSAIVPLCVFAGDGIATIHERIRGGISPYVRAIYWGWLMALVIALMLSFLA